MSTPHFFDVHTHIQFVAFKNDADLVIRRALDAGTWMVNVGTQRDTSEAAVRMAEQYPEGVYASVGLHPIHTEESYHDTKELGDSTEASGFSSRSELFDADFYRTLAEHPKVVAIGECGLDYYRLSEDTKEKQRTAFLAHIKLAHAVQKPLMIHCRNAFTDLIETLNSEFKILNSPPGVVHFFSGTVADARSLLDLGFSFSFGGVLTFARDYDEVVKFVPLDRILLETDAPYVTPAPYRGKRNEPAYVIEVAKKISEIKGISFDEVQTAATQGAKKIFGV